jgi:hypothetical protein
MNEDARSLDDEIVSAVLDGEATADEHQRVASDPVLAQRLEEFRQVSGAVGEPVVPLDELTRRRLLDRALEHADPPAVTLSAPRRTRSRFGFGGAAAVAAAAVVGLLALAGGNVLLESMGDDEGDMASPMADGADDAAEAESYTAADADESGAMSYLPDALEGADGHEVVWIGTHGSEAAFADAARDAADLAAAAPDPTTTTFSSVGGGTDQASRLASACPDVVDAAMARVDGPVRFVRGELDGRMLLGLVSVDDPSAPVLAVDMDSCAIVQFD